MSAGFIGHERQHAELEEQDFPVTVLTGPQSVGKLTLADHLLAHRGIPKHDTIRVTQFRAADARNMIDSAGMLTSEDPRWMVADLDGSGEQAQNMLLKLLEEPPPGLSFILVSSEPVLPTILSRSRYLKFGLLTTAQVEQVLVLRGMSEQSAKAHAPLGRGRVQPAMDGVNQEIRARVLTALRAVAAGSSSQLDAALREWDAEALLLLQTWAAEASVSRWLVFAADNVPQLTQRHARSLFGRLAQYSSADPRACTYGALAPLCLQP